MNIVLGIYKNYSWEQTLITYIFLDYVFVKFLNSKNEMQKD